MGKLLLDSLEIQNFRGFHHLQIEKLGRVNLIVGKNNIGKTALLEALHLYACKDSLSLIWEILQARDELRTPFSQADVEDLIVALKYLFSGWKDLREHSQTIQVGPMHRPDEVIAISMDWASLQLTADGSQQIKSISLEELETVDNVIPRLQFRQGPLWTANYPLLPNVPYFRSGQEEIPCLFIPANGLSRARVARLWDAIALTDFEKEVISALRVLAPGAEGINFVGKAHAKRGDFSLLGKTSLRENASLESERIPIVKIEDESEPMPLRSLGNGMVHVLDIILALALTKDGLLLIDEIENGFHYSIHQELWQMVFRVARNLNIQVFATTHSWDCIEGFQKAALDEKQEDGMLIRLSLKGEDIKPVLYDERRLEIATRERIEVR